MSTHNTPHGQCVENVTSVRPSVRPFVISWSVLWLGYKGILHPSPSISLEDRQGGRIGDRLVLYHIINTNTNDPCVHAMHPRGTDLLFHVQQGWDTKDFTKVREPRCRKFMIR